MLEICSALSNQTLKYTIVVNIQKRPKIAKWPNHFISGKQFKKEQIRKIWHLKGQMATLL